MNKKVKGIIIGIVFFIILLIGMLFFLMFHALEKFEEVSDEFSETIKQEFVEDYIVEVDTGYSGIREVNLHKYVVSTYELDGNTVASLNRVN